MLGKPVVETSDQDSPAVAIYAWEPKRGKVTVYPQYWFNGRNMDLGYEWITCIVRDPKTGHFIGGGFRINNFELDDAGTQILQHWTPLRQGERLPRL